MKYFRRIAIDIDAMPLRRQVEAVPEPWQPDQVWQQHKRGSVLYAQENLVLRYMKAQPYTRSISEWLPSARPILLGLMRVLEGAILGTVVISRLRPGERIAAHVDHWPAGVPLLYHRYQVPLRSAPGVVFRCGEDEAHMTEEVEMRPGEAWWFDNQAWHTVINGSAEDRISMFCDVATL